MREKQSGDDVPTTPVTPSSDQESVEHEREIQTPAAKRVRTEAKANKENESGKNKKKEAAQREAKRAETEKKKAETEKKKAETEKRKAEEIRRNSSFLQSLETFKNANNIQPPSQPSHDQLNREPQTFMALDSPRAVHQPSVFQPIDDQFPQPHYMDLGQTPPLHFTPRLPRRISDETQHNAFASWTPVSTMLTDVRETLHSPYEQGDPNQCYNATCALLKNDLKKARDDLLLSQQEVRQLRDRLQTTESQLRQARQIHQDEQANNIQRQTDGKPRAGCVPAEVAKDHHMIELMPSSGVFVYPKHITTCQRKEKGSQIVRYLMSVFYTNSELVECGNLMGSHGKKGMDVNIVNAILDYASAVHRKGTPSELKYSMRTKISALVSLSRKTTLMNC